ncbi:MAG TPA: hypothetical protein VHM93_17495 [Candidatus Acidoferrum sp.]|jgi:hypothetical protein|nr:hypothetical protein [Candidatus Acidoferrum sp.]
MTDQPLELPGSPSIEICADLRRMFKLAQKQGATVKTSPENHLSFQGFGEVPQWYSSPTRNPNSAQRKKTET